MLLDPVAKERLSQSRIVWCQFCEWSLKCSMCSHAPKMANSALVWCTVAIVAVVQVTVVHVNGDWTPVVKIAQGKLRGQKSLLTGQYKFLGIPYAVTQRFQPPAPPPKWEGTFNAMDPFVVCPQKIIVPMGVENCTVLNVFTPANMRSTVPVMVFFHGGSFFYGSASVTNFDPSYLVAHGVIVVTVNYRLGVLGFLCLGIEGAAGNMGLKDQAAALRWVRDNIDAFGGDPKRVTIFGESAGAASVHMHMLSSHSRGLFNAAIMQSGSAVAPWAINIRPLDDAKEDAAKLGVTSADPKDILDAFRKADLNQLLKVTKDSVLHNTCKYCPCIEKDLNEEKAFLTDTPYNLLSRGQFTKVPVVMGVNSAEGILFAGLHNYKTIEEMNRNFSDFIPRVFAWESLKHKFEAEKRIKSYYFGNASVTAEMRNLIDFYSDTLTTHAVPRTVELMAKYSSAPMYNYLFNYEGGRNFAKYFMGISLKGVSHADELFYIFKPSSFPLPISQKDSIIMHRMTKMWSNFAKTGNPIPWRTQYLPVPWLRSDVNRTIYMLIDSKMYMVRQPYQRRIDFWETIYRTYGISGLVPTRIT